MKELGCHSEEQCSTSTASWLVPRLNHGALSVAQGYWTPTTKSQTPRPTSAAAMARMPPTWPISTRPAAPVCCALAGDPVPVAAPALVVAEPETVPVSSGAEDPVTELEPDPAPPAEHGSLPE